MFLKHRYECLCYSHYHIIPQHGMLEILEIFSCGRQELSSYKFNISADIPEFWRDLFWLGTG